MAVRKQFLDLRNILEASLSDKSKPWTPAFDFLERKTHLRRSYIFVGIACCCAANLLFGYGAQLLCNIIGVAYPAYASLHAIESSEKKDDIKWLIYWVIYSVMTIVEYFSAALAAFISFYWFMKCCFIMWCIMPGESCGSLVIYRNVLRPFFLKQQKAAEKTGATRNFLRR